MNAVRWGTIGGLILVHLIVDFFCPLFAFRGPDQMFVQMIVLGICVAQVDLIAVWATLGGGRWIVRLPWAVLLATLMWFGMVWGNRVAHPSTFQAEDALQLGVVLLGGIFVAQVPLWIARAAFRWRLQTPRIHSAVGIRDTQFQIFHVMLGTTLVAVALALGRAALPPGEIRMPRLDRELPALLAATAICNVLITAPCIRIAFARWSLVLVSALVWILYVLVVSVIEIATLIAVLGPAHKEVWWGISLFNLVQWFTVFGTLLLLRLIGFDLLRRSDDKRSPEATLPSPS